MKRLFILFSIISGGFSQITNNIDSLVLGRYDGSWFGGQKLSFTTVMYFNKDISVLINKSYNRDLTDLIVTQIDKGKADKYLIRFDPGPSADPAYEIYKVTDKDTVVIGIVDANEFVAPGDNFFYTSKRVDWMFNRRKKYSINNNKLQEIIQPYYYVGIQSKTAKELSIYKDTLYLEPVAKLLQGADVFVLLNINDNYLIKISNDLTGWIKIPFGDGGSIIYDIFFAGD